MTERSVIVIGGGVAGLVAATQAARAGARVELLEAATALGGRARTREREGFRFNLGPHALYLGSEAARELAALGIEPRGVRPPASGGLAYADDRLYALPIGAASMLTTRLLPLADKLALGRWLAELPRMDTRPLDGETLEAALCRMLAGARAQQLVRAFVRLTSYVHAPAIQSAGAALRQLQLATEGVIYLHGGWSQLVEALTQAAREAGVTLRARAHARSVTSVSPSGSTRPRIRVHAGAGLLWSADAVVLAVAPAHASALLGGTDPGLRESAERSIPVRAATLDLGLQRLPQPRRTFCLGIDRPSYLSVHSIARGLAPEGAAQLQVARYLAPDEKPDRAELERELHALVDRVQPGWRTQVVTQSLLTDLCVTHALPTAERGGRAGRAAVASPTRPGILLAGDWVGARGELVDAAFASGADAGRLAARGA